MVNSGHTQITFTFLKEDESHTLATKTGRHIILCLFTNLNRPS